MSNISKDDVYPKIRLEFANKQDGHIKFSELSNWLSKEFGANPNQVSGLIYRMHAKDGILEKVKGVRATYRLILPNQNNSNELFSFASNEINDVIKKIKIRAINSLVDLDIEELEKVQKLLVKLDEFLNDVKFLNKK